MASPRPKRSIVTARLQDKAVIITGASSGFGRGIAKACAAEGAKVVVSDAHENPSTGGFEDDPSLTTVQAIQKAGGTVTYVGCNATKEDHAAVSPGLGTPQHPKQFYR